MAVLGISGLFTTEQDDHYPTTFYKYSHDAAACVVNDGKTLAAVEEERLNRDKHTFRFPIHAVRASLDAAGLTPRAIERVAYYFEEDYVDADLARVAADDPLMPYRPARERIRDRLAESLGREFADEDLVFVSHHHTHAASAFYDSGFDSALVVVSDGNAERDGISIFTAGSDGLELLHSYSRDHSLGHFYTAVTKMIGYRNFDEYKVMGLASFGDPARYRKLFDGIHSLETGGEYHLSHEEAVAAMLESGLRPRRSDEPITQSHKDLAAAAQEVLERVSVHVITHWRAQTGADRLCMAGGVAQNTSLNGKLLSLKGLRSIYIPAAAHDAGAALGAAMLTEQKHKPARAGDRYSPTAYLGTTLGTDAEIGRGLERWREFIDFDAPVDLEATVAAALADGAVVGWAHGRAEFGPRALGNRSILADPRPAENRDRVNQLIKKREDYRPFAPVVTREDAETFFELSDVDADHSYMGFVVPVRPEHRARLGATTHVDGTSRIQVLDPDQNPRFWRLLKKFEALTGVPVLLNTSFNNNAEPIVQSVDDVVASFITTGLTLLAIGPYLARRRDEAETAIDHARLELMPLCAMGSTTTRLGSSREIWRSSYPSKTTAVTEPLAETLAKAGRISDLPVTDDVRGQLRAEAYDLWQRRLIRVLPAPSGS